MNTMEGCRIIIINSCCVQYSSDVTLARVVKCCCPHKYIHLDKFEENNFQIREWLAFHQSPLNLKPQLIEAAHDLLRVCVPDRL